MSSRLSSIATGVLTAGLIALTLLANRLAPDRVVAIGGGLGRLWLRMGGPRTQCVREQLGQAFPDRDAEWIASRTEEVFVHLGRGLAELILLCSRHREVLLDRVEVEGLEHIETATRASPTGGVLVVTAHLGNWELAAAKTASLGVPVSAVYRELRNPVFDRAIQSLRAGGAGAEGHFEQVPMGRAGLGFVRALRAGRKVLVLLDQNARREEGVFVPFFDRPASTRFGPIRLAARLGVPVVPAFIRRDLDARGHRIRIHPVLELEPGGSEDDAVLRRNVERVTAAIEAEIREVPGQWIWAHRRWRTRPAIEERTATENS